MAYGGADSPFDVVEDAVEHSWGSPAAGGEASSSESWHVVDSPDCPVDTKAVIGTTAADDMVGIRNAFQELLHATIRIRDIVAPVHADMVIWNLVKADSHPLIFKSIPTRNVNERCLNENCGFRAHHNVAEFAGYCCKKCGIEKFKGSLDNQHGWQCQRIEADQPSWQVADTDR